MNKKIDIYLKHLNGYFQYECSTNRSKTCKEAKARFLELHKGISPDQVKASFAKER